MIDDAITYSDPSTGKQLATIAVEMQDDGEVLHKCQIENGPSRNFMEEGIFDMASAKFRARSWVETELDKLFS